MAGEKDILPEDGSWVGPPVLYLKLRLHSDPELLDGEKRLAEVRRRGLTKPVPILEVTSELEAIRQLAFNGHYDRAAERALTKAPEYAVRSRSAVESALGFGRKHANAFIRALKSPEERHKLPRRTWDVVLKVRSIYKGAVEGKPILLEDIEDALGEFIKD